MRPVQDYPAHLLEIAFKEDATIYELLTIALAFAVFWGLFFEVGKILLRRLTYGRPCPFGVRKRVRTIHEEDV
jgi:hypothetical protein